MIVDVANLDLAALRCYAFYNASTIALSEQYGMECNVVAYEDKLQSALTYLFLAENCADNLTTSIFCSIQEFISDLKHNSLYLMKIEEDCNGTGNNLTPSFCVLTVTDNATSCTGNLSINILQ